MSILPNLIYIFCAIAIKMPASYFMDINKGIVKFMWSGKRPRIVNTIVKENKVRGLMLFNIKTYCKLQ